jgi:hypothetical protein
VSLVRILVVSAPMLGHVFPLVPLSRALHAAGHDVVIATGAEGLAVSRAGLPVENVAPKISFAAIAMRTMLRHPVIARSELAGTAGTRGVALLFGAVNDRRSAPEDRDRGIDQGETADGQEQRAADRLRGPLPGDGHPEQRPNPERDDELDPQL